MKKHVVVVLILLFAAGANKTILAQTDFSFNDDDAQVCVEDPIQITNNTPSGTTYDWNLCYGRLTSVPQAATLSTTSLSGPAFNRVVYDGTDYYLFITNHADSTITRLTLGDDPGNTPSDETKLTAPELPKKVQGLTIEYHDGNWYGFVAGGQNSSRLVRIDFGTDLSNPNPTFTNLGFDNALGYPQDMEFVFEDSLWYAFAANLQDNNVVRFDFDSTLTNIPQVDTLQGITLSQPAGLELLEAAGNFHLFVTNYNPPGIVRIDLGTDLTQLNPASSSISDPSLQSPFDITITKDCRNYAGFTVNRQEDNIIRLDFGAGIASPPSNFENLGNLGALYHAQGISRIVTTGQGDRYFFVTNVDSDEVSRLSVRSCEASYRVSDDTQLTTLQDTEPPAYYYNAPGTYNVQLITDKGLVSESRECKQIQVFGGSLNLGPDTTICPLDTLMLSVDPSLEDIFWQDNTSNPTYPVTNAGTYSARATNNGCELTDSITIETYPDNLNLGPDTIMTLGTSITLDAGDFESYQWNTGASTRTIEVDDEGLYLVEATDENGCLLQDTIQIDLRVKDIPNVFTPNGDGINDTWQLDFKHTFPDAIVKIYNRYGRLLKQFDVSEENWDGRVNGELLPPDTYWYVVDYQGVLQSKKGYVTIKY